MMKMKMMIVDVVDLHLKKKTKKMKMIVGDRKEKAFDLEGSKERKKKRKNGKNLERVSESVGSRAISIYLGPLMGEENSSRCVVHRECDKRDEPSKEEVLWLSLRSRPVPLHSTLDASS